MHLSARRGGNVILRHNEIRDELADLASKAIVPSAVRNEPLILVAPSQGARIGPRSTRSFPQLA
jgi:hypothetical protein